MCDDAVNYHRRFYVQHFLKRKGSFWFSAEPVLRNYEKQIKLCCSKKIPPIHTKHNSALNAQSLTLLIWWVLKYQKRKNVNWFVLLVFYIAYLKLLGNNNAYNIPTMCIIISQLIWNLSMKNGKHHQSAGYVPETCLSVLYVLCNVISPTVITVTEFMTSEHFEKTALV